MQNKATTPLIESMENRLLLSATSLASLLQSLAHLPADVVATVQPLKHQPTAKVKDHDKKNAPPKKEKKPHVKKVHVEDKPKPDKDQADNGDEKDGNNSGGHTTGAGLTVTGNGQSIATGDTTPSATDGTNFGSIPLAQDGPVRQFILTNTTGSAIDINVIDLPAGFAVVGSPQTPIAAHSRTTLTIQLDNSTVATRTGQVSISTSASTTPITFTITGTVTAA